MANTQTLKGMCKCRQCKEKFRRNQLSKRRLCISCSAENERQCIVQLQNKKGEYFDRWLRGVRRAAQRI